MQLAPIDRLAIRELTMLDVAAIMAKARELAMGE
jgi:hypothetical protein